MKTWWSSIKELKNCSLNEISQVKSSLPWLKLVPIGAKTGWKF